jgi:hypothetical protein
MAKRGFAFLVLAILLITVIYVYAAAYDASKKQCGLAKHHGLISGYVGTTPYGVLPVSTTPAKCESVEPCMINGVPYNLCNGWVASKPKQIVCPESKPGIIISPAGSLTVYSTCPQSLQPEQPINCHVMLACWATEGGGWPPSLDFAKPTTPPCPGAEQGDECKGVYSYDSEGKLTGTIPKGTQVSYSIKVNAGDTLTIHEGGVGLGNDFTFTAGDVTKGPSECTGTKGKGWAGGGCPDIALPAGELSVSSPYKVSSGMISYITRSGSGQACPEGALPSKDGSACCGKSEDDCGLVAGDQVCFKDETDAWSWGDTSVVGSIFASNCPAPLQLLVAPGGGCGAK